MKTEITDTMASCLMSVVFAINSAHKGSCGDHVIYEVQFSESQLEILERTAKAYYDTKYITSSICG